MQRPFPILLTLLASLLVVFAAIAGSAPPPPAFAEDFETDLSAWKVADAGAMPLVLSDKRAASGKQSAYSGPPGSRRVMRHDFAQPVVGRLEVRFYDDMAPAKHQMAIAVGEPKVIIGLTCRGGTHYQARIGTTYSGTPVKRTKGWHLFAWECDGQRTAGFIDGEPVAVNEGIDRIRGIVLGSFWDASTGWYDDVRCLALKRESTRAVAEAMETLRQRDRQRIEELRAMLAAERPKLGGIYRVRPHRALGPETPLSRECYRRLLRYVRHTQPQFRDWPHAPGCRYHKHDLHGEQAVRQNATVALGYATLVLGDYDEKIAGAPRAKLEADLVALLRYIAITHKVNLLPTGDGSPWGDQWQSALWAHWAGHAAWLVWDRLDDDTRLMFARLITHEANRFNSRPPDSGEWSDTKAEENAWNSMVITLAECMFPQHPNAKLWRERAIVYLINSYTREADREEERIVDGRAVKERVCTVTVHPDFTLENHGRVHPDYLGCFGLMLRSAVLYAGAGVEPPEALRYNVPQAWGVLKTLTATNGSYFYINGQDWWPHRHGSPATVSAVASVLLRDPDAAFLERATLDFLGRMHARFDDGSAWHPREYNYRNAEEEMLARYSEILLLHRLLGDGPEPVSREEFLRRQSGTRLYDIGGFVTHRTPSKHVSFAWVNGAMGLVYPADDTWFTSPSERGMVGRIACRGVKDTQPKVLARKVDARDNGFALAARIARCGGKVEQWVALFSLGDAPVLYLERLIARADVDVTEVATGTAPILNEDAPGISPNRRVVAHAGGTETIAGLSKNAPRLLRWETHWANVDGKLGVLCTAGSMAWRDANAYRRSRLEEELIAHYRADVGRIVAGKELSRCAVAFVPNQPPEATAASRLELAGDGAVLAARLGSVLVAANLGTGPAEAKLFGRTVALKSLGTVVLSDH